MIGPPWPLENHCWKNNKSFDPSFTLRACLSNFLGEESFFVSLDSEENPRLEEERKSERILQTLSSRQNPLFHRLLGLHLPSSLHRVLQIHKGQEALKLQGVNNRLSCMIGNNPKGSKPTQG